MRRFTTGFFLSCFLFTCMAIAAQAQTVTPRTFMMNASGDDYDLYPPPIGVTAGVAQGRDGLLGITGYGSPRYDSAQVGRVGVFRFESDGRTVRTGSIDLNDRLDNEMYFGTALALDAGTAIVMSSVAMRVYGKDNGTWQERSRTLPDSAHFAFAAGPLAFKANALAIPVRDLRDSQAPLRIFIYEITARGKARHVATLRVGEEGCSLSSLALRQHTLAVGVPCDGGTGAVYVFEEGNDISHWKLAERVVAAVPQDGASFGNSVDLRNGTLIAGAPYEAQTIPQDPDSGEFSWGVGYVFERSGHHWTQTQRVDPSLMGIGARASFGWSAAITGTRVAFSSPFGTTGRYEDFTNVDVFRWQGGTLVYDQSLQGNLYYGEYMHSTKHWLVIGQPGDPYGSEYATAVSFDDDFP